MTLQVHQEPHRLKVTHHQVLQSIGLLPQKLVAGLLQDTLLRKENWGLNGLGSITIQLLILTTLFLAFAKGLGMNLEPLLAMKLDQANPQNHQSP